MKRERRKPTRAEWERITTRRPVVRLVRRIPKSKKRPRGEKKREARADAPPQEG